jgi:hypothetical protein
VYNKNMGENNTYINLDLIRTKKIVIATPIYGTEIELKHFLSILQLNTFAIQNNLNIHYIYKNGDALIARVRNDLVDIFLEMDGDYLFFIDSDISFSVDSFLNTVSIAIKNNQYITTAAYPQKSIHWDKIKKADSLGLIESEKDYEAFSGHYGINFFNKTTINLLEPQEILDGSTGFMLINKNVFDEIKKIFPEQLNVTYEGNETFAYFDCKIDEKTKVYLSEDYTFCRFAQKANIKVWFLPWINLNHTGSYTYKGSFTQFSTLNSMV